MDFDCNGVRSELTEIEKNLVKRQENQEFVRSYFAFATPESPGRPNVVEKILVLRAEEAQIPTCFEPSRAIKVFRAGSIILTLNKETSDETRSSIAQTLRGVSWLDVRNVFGLTHVVVCEPKARFVSDALLAHIFTRLNNTKYLSKTQYEQVVEEFGVPAVSLQHTRKSLSQLKKKDHE